jgi:hypothetical protein
MDDFSPDSCSLGVRSKYGLENGRTDGFPNPISCFLGTVAVELQEHHLNSPT